MSEILSLSDLDFGQWAEALRRRFEDNAQRALPVGDGPLGKLCEAMRYAVLDGGKRVRALLVYGAGLLTQAPIKALDEAALAVEYVHAYSLVHDDLPCMDNDVLRRGKPTAHVKFGEAQAMLAGDSLQPEAFERLAQSGLPDAQINALTFCLARASGLRGMCGGQMIDLSSVGQKIDIDTLRRMHELKTGALINAACVTGVIAGGGTQAQIQAAGTFAGALGMAFQIRDDMLDVIGDAKELGKAVGVDGKKNTFVRLYGLEKCEQLVQKYTDVAIQALSAFEDHDHMAQLARSLTARTV